METSGGGMRAENRAKGGEIAGETGHADERKEDVGCFALSAIIFLAYCSSEQLTRSEAE